MAIKKLQNNFTTPEQSKRLLELGVPRWTADEYRDKKSYRHSLEGILDVELFFKNFPDYLPCWSVGRLIEIHAACAGTSSSYYIHTFPTSIMNEVMWHFVEAIKKGWINLSKLEE